MMLVLVLRSMRSHVFGGEKRMCAGSRKKGARKHIDGDVKEGERGNREDGKTAGNWNWRMEGSVGGRLEK